MDGAEPFYSEWVKISTKCTSETTQNMSKRRQAKFPLKQKSSHFGILLSVKSTHRHTSQACVHISIFALWLPHLVGGIVTYLLMILWQWRVWWCVVLCWCCCSVLWCDLFMSDIVLLNDVSCDVVLRDIILSDGKLYWCGDLTMLYYESDLCCIVAW